MRSTLSDDYMSLFYYSGEPLAHAYTDVLVSNQEAKNDIKTKRPKFKTGHELINV